jgi:DNA recombination protein RmuC
MTTTTVFALALALGLLLGAAAAWALGSVLGRLRTAGLRAERALLAERVTDLEAAAGQDRELASTLSPLSATLQRVEQQVRTLERDRVEQFSRLDEQLTAVRASEESLRQQTAALSGALRAPTARGAWGEVQLRRVVEHAGMLHRVDFSPQVTARTPDGVVVRPDLVVHLPGGKQLVIDSKAPLSAFLQASEPEQDSRGPDGTDASWVTAGAQRVLTGRSRHARAAAEHARAVRQHVDALAAKEYWTAFASSPELVVCFVPGESFLAAACDADPTLLEHAMSRRVILATPMTLLALLRTVAYSWQTEALSGNARELFEVGRQLYARLGQLGGHTGKLGRDLQRAVEDYNALVGTLERRVLVSARRISNLAVADAELPTISGLEVSPRPLIAPELVET